MITPLDPMRALLSGQVTPVEPVAHSAGETAPRTGEGKSFADVLTDFVKDVDRSQRQYDQAVGAVVSGQTDNLHRVMLAQSEAQMSLMLAVQVRNKLVDAYKETMRMQI